MSTGMLSANIVAGPLVWLLTLQTKYALQPFACWYGWGPALHAVTAAGMILALGSGFAAWRSWRAAGGGPPGEGDATADRDRFLALLGLGTSAFSALAILGQGIADVTLRPCQ